MKNLYYLLIGTLIFFSCSTTPKEVASDCMANEDNKKIYGTELQSYCKCVEQRLTKLGDVTLTDSIVEAKKQECAEEKINLDTDF